MSERLPNRPRPPRPPRSLLGRLINWLERPGRLDGLLDYTYAYGMVAVGALTIMSFATDGVVSGLLLIMAVIVAFLTGMSITG